MEDDPIIGPEANALPEPALGVVQALAAGAVRAEAPAPVEGGDEG